MAWQPKVYLTLMTLGQFFFFTPAGVELRPACHTFKKFGRGDEKIDPKEMNSLLETRFASPNDV